MKALNIVTLILVIVGGLNWGLVGLLELRSRRRDLRRRLAAVAAGLHRRRPVGAWQIVPLVGALGSDEPSAIRG
jgi:uncharacterized protein